MIVHYGNFQREFITGRQERYISRPKIKENIMSNKMKLINDLTIKIKYNSDEDGYFVVDTISNIRAYGDTILEAIKEYFLKNPIQRVTDKF